MQAHRGKRNHSLKTADASAPENAARNGHVLALLVVAAVVLAVDLISKSLAFSYIDGGAITVIPQCLSFRLSENRGAVFGIGQGMQTFFLIFTLVALGGIAWAYRAWGRTSLLLTCGLGLLTGGALGNAWDRLFLGHVRDFIDVYIGTYHWPTFNVADMAICTGAAIVALFSLRKQEEPARQTT